MSKLGVLGAIRGAGEGIMVNAERAATEAAAERQSRIDEARDMRLLKAQQAFQATTREDEQGHDVGMLGAQTGATRDLAFEEQTMIAGREAAAREDQAAENQLDRESAERIASTRSEGSSAAEIEALERFERVSGSTSTRDAFGGTTETPVATVYDKETRQTLIQNGNRFIQQGVDPTSIRAAAPAAIDLLLEHPEMASQFLEMYNYLPANFVETLPSRRTR